MNTETIRPRRRPAGHRDLLDREFDADAIEFDRMMRSRFNRDETTVTHRKPNRSELDAIWFGLVR